MGSPSPQAPASVRAGVDAQAAEVCSDTGVLDEDLAERLVPLIIAARIADDLAGLWSARRGGRGLQEDYASAMFLELVDHVREIDRRRIADGASFCGWMRSWGMAVSLKVEREVTNTTRPTAVPVGSRVSLEALAETAGIGDPGALMAARRSAPPSPNNDPDLVDPQQVRAALARRRGASRQEAVSRVVRDALGITPLIRPQDPVDTQTVRSLIADEPRLACLSLDVFCALVDGDRAPSGRDLVPEAMICMWDSTTAEDRQRLDFMPDRILALLVEDAVRLAPRPRQRVRRAVRRALGIVARQAPARLLDELAAAFWDESTEPVSDHRTNIAAARREAIRREAALNARRLPGLVRELTRIPGERAGRDAEEVRTFLCQAWAVAEAAAPRETAPAWEQAALDLAEAAAPRETAGNPGRPGQEEI